MAKTFQTTLSRFKVEATNLANFPKLRILRKLCTSNDGSQHSSIYFKNPIIWGIKKRTNNSSRLQFLSTCPNKLPGTKCPKVSKSKESVCLDKPSKWPTGIKANFKFHQETEAMFNEQIQAEFKAFYYYLSMASYFGQVDVALPGCESFFKQMHHEEHCHALQLMNYVKLRGGSVVLCPIKSPDNQDWKCPLNAFKTALQLEMEVTEKLESVNTVAEKHGDLNASDFIITYYMEDQMKSINEMARLVTVLSGVGDQSLARFIFDKELLENYVKPPFNIFKNSDVFQHTEKLLKK